MIESWHSTLEFELRRMKHFTTRADASREVAAWIDDYNRNRLHSALRQRAPIDHEFALREQKPERAA